MSPESALLSIGSPVDKLSSVIRRELQMAVAAVFREFLSHENPVGTERGAARENTARDKQGGNKCLSLHSIHHFPFMENVESKRDAKALPRRIGGTCRAFQA